LAGSWLATATGQRRRSATGAVGGALAVILVLFPLLILTGSRAGLLLSLPALLISTWLLLRAPAMRQILARAGRRARLLIGGVVALLFLPLLLVFGVLATSERMTALSRLFEADTAEDVRWQYLPIIKQMAVDFAPWGSGFGSFEKAFNLYEPSHMLNSRYLNQAHNDFMQIIIEGGVAALIILLVAMAWFGHVLWRTWRSSEPGGTNLAIFGGGSALLWLAASLVDYPLRTPLATMLVAALTTWISIPSTRRPFASGLSESRGREVSKMNLASAQFDVRD
jgi:hypothetical protein